MYEHVIQNRSDSSAAPFWSKNTKGSILPMVNSTRAECTVQFAGANRCVELVPVWASTGAECSRSARFLLETHAVIAPLKKGGCRVAAVLGRSGPEEELAFRHRPPGRPAGDDIATPAEHGLALCRRYGHLSTDASYGADADFGRDAVQRVGRSAFAGAGGDGFLFDRFQAVASAGSASLMRSLSSAVARARLSASSVLTVELRGRPVCLPA